MLADHFWLLFRRELWTNFAFLARSPLPPNKDSHHVREGTADTEQGLSNLELWMVCVGFKQGIIVSHTGLRLAICRRRSWLLPPPPKCRDWRHVQHPNLEWVLGGPLNYKIWGWRNCSVVKNTYFSCRRLEFNPQNPYQVIHSYLQLQL